ncbi:MAG: DMT family transporter [Bacteroidota bacterium]
MQKMLSSWVLLIVLALIWGSSFILMKLGMYDEKGGPIFSSVQVGALRMLIASIVLLPFALKSLQQLKNWKNVAFLLTVGLCGNFFPSFLFTFAETKLSSGMAGMLNSFTSISTILIGFLVFGVRLKWLQLVGVLIALSGLYLMTLYKSGATQNVHFWHITAILLATLMYGISLNTIRHKLQHLKPIETTSLAFFLIGVPSLVMTFISGAPQTLAQHPQAWKSLFFITVLAIVGTAVAVIIFNKLIKDTSALFASMVTYLIPIVAVIIGLNFGEKIHLHQIIAMFVVIGGVVLVNLAPILLAKREN